MRRAKNLHQAAHFLLLTFLFTILLLYLAVTLPPMAEVKYCYVKGNYSIIFKPNISACS